jgi:hypothetical protein
MTFGERVQAVAKQGFTERQARFLTTVMLHAGVCVPRQYARFCGIVHGEKTPKFFAKLVRPQYASMYDCRHNRARRSLESRRPISLTSPSVRVTPERSLLPRSPYRSASTWRAVVCSQGSQPQ